MAAMGKTAKLTVCIPCFNEERFIGEAIESVLRQDYRDFLLLVVDDCSTDGTLEAVRRFTDSRIVIHRNRRNLGLYQNQNRCLVLAKTGYVKILCADDILDPTCLAEQAAVLDREPTVALVFGASQVIDSRGKVLLKRRFSSPGKLEGRELVRTILTSGRNPLGEPSGVMFRKSIVDEHHLRLRSDEYRHVADLEFWMQLLEHGDGYYMDRKLFSFRLHPRAGTRELLKHSIAEHRRLLSRYGERYSVSRAGRMLFQLKLYLYFVGKMALVRLFAR